MAVTKICCPSAKLAFCTTVRSASVNAFSINATARGPDGAGRAVRKTKHPRRLYGQCYFQRNGGSQLVNVARASLEELLEDYRDFLRTRGQPLWEKDSPKHVRSKTGGKERCVL